MLAEISLDLKAWGDLIQRFMDRLAGYYQTLPIFFWACIGLVALFIICWGWRGRREK